MGLQEDIKDILFRGVFLHGFSDLLGSFPVCEVCLLATETVATLYALEVPVRTARILYDYQWIIVSLLLFDGVMAEFALALSRTTGRYIIMSLRSTVI